MFCFEDDLNSEKFALSAGLMGYEGAKQGSKIHGLEEQVHQLYSLHFV